MSTLPTSVKGRPPKKECKILVINPNSSQSMTQSLMTLFETSPPPSHVTLSFFTGPTECPESIDDAQGCHDSAEACLPLLLPSVRARAYDAYLVACYSEHPLPALLRDAAASGGTPVYALGIFEASVLYSLAHTLPNEKFGIITTGKAWEPLLTDALDRFLGAPNSTRFAGVISTGYTAGELHKVPRSDLYRKIGEAAKVLVHDRGARVICLGCAGMVGMEDAIVDALGDEWAGKIVIVDGVRVGVRLLSSWMV
ncbi:Asp/glu/hydantoin racemase [Rhizoctonia solani AG-3 Rhs1AP]|uniref:Asp/glu/hydantoin racemase n=2 Tax=Rhizoctonia solani AG-3 TaxID=1086053 RepID=A0A074RIS3_9AGAM|nr:Asp/glu/hydantoin racemase [Rhizoctonia solani AG-3 Rhs1AP]KEP47011.1 Asp/glu/hydantoin racemase [Rhizoctonia solani 123E]